MTAYSAIADSDIDPESPITTGLMTKLRDNPIAIAEGSSGAPTVDNAIGANWPAIATATASGSATIEFSGLDGSYDRYILEIYAIEPATSGTDLLLQFSDDGGSTWIATEYGSDYNGTQATAATSIKLLEGLETSTHDGAEATVWFNNLGKADTPITARCAGSVYRNVGGSANFMQAVNSSGGVETASCNAFKLYMSSGNIESGYFVIYGVRAL